MSASEPLSATEPLSSTEPLSWVGVDLPHRKCDRAFCTYHAYSAAEMPPVAIDARFEKIQTRADLERNLSMLREAFYSPPACYFDLEAPGNVFYRDQQDCVLWCLREDGRVYLQRDGSVVANSLPEFLTRLDIENKLWFKTVGGRPHSASIAQILTPAEHAYLLSLEEISNRAAKSPKDPQ